jgi:hypothetical protein
MAAAVAPVQYLENLRGRQVREFQLTEDAMFRM